MEKRNILKDKASIFLSCLLALFLLYGLLVPSPSIAADDSVCARVKIEIQQELTLERQAFDAHMRINNGLSNITLENVDIDVSFSDENGNIVRASFDPNDTTALFFIRLDSMENINNVDGTGTVQPSSTADIHWLIIPAPGASNGLSQGKLFYVGATLKYTIGGEEHVTTVTPDYIFVKPVPELTLDYFLPTDVYGDDAFTPEIEPVIPFSLGVRVKNSGAGAAKNLKIDSAQPKIVENEQGLLIGFNIEGTEVNGQTATNSLLADFGDIQPNTSGVARWIMTCTLSGKFVEFTAEFSHSDELGGELTSLIDAVNTHFLVHDVLVDLPGRDNSRDFLATDGGVYRVYESDNVDTEVLDQSASSTLQFTSQVGSDMIYTLSTPITAGFMYVQLPDPFSGQKIVKEVIRSDGKRIKQENAWLSKTRVKSDPWQHFINLFDVNTTNSYTVVFGDPAAGNRPPVLQFIPDRTGYEGQQLSFIVEASDPDGTIPVLSATPLPAGAIFRDQGNLGNNGIATGIFDWTPVKGQAGHYEITFTASDGLLKDTKRSVITIKVESENNPPNVPSSPSPPDGATDVSANVVLNWQGGDPDVGDEVVYSVYFGTSPTPPLVSSGQVTSYTPGQLKTSTKYYWQIIAKDSHNSETSGPVWSFTTKNDPPFVPSSPSPSNEAANIDANIILSWQGGDPDTGDTVKYDVYLDSNNPPLNKVSSNQLDTSYSAAGLEYSTTYYWKIVARDSSGAETLGPVWSFTTNKPPVANAGPVQNVITNTLVTLNGSGSYDPERDLITFQWGFMQVPAGSRVTDALLSDMNSAKPEFTPDVDGTYKLELIVNDGILDSTPAEVLIIAAIPNVAPNANAGPDQNVLTGQRVSVNGSESNDPDNLPTPLCYLWSFESVPETSVVTDDDINGMDQANASFNTDVDGPYVLRLTVSDGELTSEDTVQITAASTSVPPNAHAGADITIYLDDTAVLDGSASNDPDNNPQPLTYSWSFVAVPAGSQVNNDSISRADTITPSFVPDIAGTYVVELTVSDGFAFDHDNVAVTVISNHPPEVEDLSVTTNEDTTVDITLTGSDPDADLLTFSVANGPSNGALSGTLPNLTYTPNLNFHGSDSFTYIANDGIEDSAIAKVAITINEVNDPPVCSDDNATTDEDTSVTIAVISNDSGGPPDEDQTLTVESVTQGINGTVVINIDGSVTYTPNPNYNGSDSFTYTVSDSGSQTDTGTVMITVNPVNDAPVSSVDLSSQTIQYSDTIIPVTITARDMDSSSLSAYANLPDGLSLNMKNCTSIGDSTNCTWTIEGQALVGIGTYDIKITITDGELTNDVSTSFVLTAEDAGISFDSDNPVSVMVANPGGNSGTFALKVNVFEIAEPVDSPGDINLANVKMILAPVGPGTNINPTGTCVIGSGYEAILKVSCNFSNVPVNTYTLQVTVDGNYYDGYAEDVLVVYDPSLGFATGGGWFYWPGTDNPETDYLGDRTNFGFTMKYTKKGTNLQGSLLIIRHLLDGTIYRVKSNALYGLSLGKLFENGEPFGWASFSGKSTFLEPDWLVPEGNYEFIVYVEDRNEPGTGTDRFWIEVRDKDGKLVSGMSLAAPATNKAEQLNGGNIVVPHR